jgi:hypothetical protein
MFYLKDYCVGRRLHRGESCQPRARYGRVLVVPSSEIERFMGCKRGPRLT